MSDDAFAIEREAQSVRQQLKRAMRRMLDPHGVASRLFRAKDGTLKEDAVAWVEWLGRRSFLDQPTWDPDPRVHAFNEGRRALAMEIIAGMKLDTRRLDALARQLREADDE